MEVYGLVPSHVANRETLVNDVMSKISGEGSLVPRLPHSGMRTLHECC